MRLGNVLTLTSIYVECEAELQKASTEAELHGHSSDGTSSGSLRTPADSSQPVTGATSAVRTPPHHSAGKDPTSEDVDDDDDDDPPGFHRQHD